MAISKLKPKKKNTAAIDAAAKKVHAQQDKSNAKKRFNTVIPVSFYEELKEFTKETGMSMTAVFIAGSKKFMKDYRS